MRLLTAIKIQAKCKLDSELKTLPAEKKRRLADLVEKTVPSGLAPIDEWNEVIACFVEEKPIRDHQKAKETLLSILRQE